VLIFGETKTFFNSTFSTMCCSMIPKIIKTGFSAIHLIYFFTAGPDEVPFFFYLVPVLYVA
jgi:ribosome-binding ATPase YchF (GTP1/OBG family)